jgi:cytochrome o ubiquinol oxidase subunit IV
MSEPADNCSDQQEVKQLERRRFRSYFWSIGLALLLAMVPLALVHWIGMPRVSLSIVNGSDQPELKQQERREFRSYLWGIGLALLLTVVPFALVHWVGLPRVPLLIVIGAFALTQMLVHFRCFLHIGFGQTREDLQLILFAALLLTIMVAGTIWIMASLALRMTMPMSP